MSTSLPSFGELLHSLGPEDIEPTHSSTHQQASNDTSTHFSNVPKTFSMSNPDDRIPSISHCGQRKGRLSRYSPYRPPSQVYSRRNSLVEPSESLDDPYMNNSIQLRRRRSIFEGDGRRPSPILTELNIAPCAPISTLLRKRSPQASPTSPMFPSSAPRSPHAPVTIPTLPTLPNYTMGLPSHYTSSRNSDSLEVPTGDDYYWLQRSHSRTSSSESTNSLASAVSALSMDSDAGARNQPRSTSPPFTARFSKASKPTGRRS